MYNIYNESFYWKRFNRSDLHLFVLRYNRLFFLNNVIYTKVNFNSRTIELAYFVNNSWRFNVKLNKTMFSGF